VARPELATEQLHRPTRQYGQAVKAQTGKVVEWSKQNAINTKRMQDHLDKEAEKAAKSVEFLGLPTKDDFLATVGSLLVFLRSMTYSFQGLLLLVRKQY
jgi:adenine-specific DNA methylase